MLYELRIYQPVPGRMPKLLARFADQTIPIWVKHGIRPIGFWTTLIGASSSELTYILTWELPANAKRSGPRSRTTEPGAGPATTASATDP